MATDGRRVNRPYRKASEYLANKQPTYNGPKTLAALESENAELRDKLTTSVRRLETMEVEFEQSREYFSTQLDVTVDKLNRTTQSLKVMQKSYAELQSVNYELEQRVLKVNELEDDRIQMTSDIHELTNKLTEARSSLQKMQHENERLRKDCNLAVSLLECNAGNFKKPTARQLPQDVQGRVEEYQMDISKYNEYINPYAADSDSDEEQPRQHYGTNLDAVPVELISNVLKKPENVYLNLENTDFIRDPDLNSVYKGQIKEKKLVKYDYDRTNQQQAERTFPSVSHENQFKVMPSRSENSVQSSSPWELAPSSGSSSPWEMNTNPMTQRENDDAADYSAASAYGAYPVAYRNTKPKQRQNHKNSSKTQKISENSEKPKTYAKTKMSNSFNKVTSPNMVKKPSQKGTGENNDVYIAETYKQNDARERAPTTSSSGQSSRKSTPAHEKGSTAEKSSLLDLRGSDEEDMVMTIELGGKGPPKVGMGSPTKREYRRQKFSSEDRGLLNESDPEPDERELDHEEEEKGNVREYDEESDLREFGEKSNLKELNAKSIFEKPVEHEMPDLLNMDENVEVYSSTETTPIHNIMMQQSYQQDLAGLLPSLPPPSVGNYSNELILDDVPAPPPPDMFGGIVPPPIMDQSYLVSMTHPPVQDQSSNIPETHSSFSHQSYQSNLVTSQAETNIMTSQVPPSSSLDDLNAVIKQEFSKAQNIEATSHEVEQNIDDDPQTLGEEVTGLNSISSDQVDNAVPNVTDNQEETGNDITNDDTNIEENENLTEIHEKEDVPELPENQTEKEETKFLHSGSDENDIISSPVSEDNQSGTTDETSDIAQEAVDNEEETSSGLMSQQSTATIEEPLEVVELEAEPRGASSNNRRRRNSFENAREYGNVMVD